MTDLLASDFYAFQDEALTAREKESVLALREYLETSVRPVADACWVRAEFPAEVVKPLAELGCYGAAWPETRRFENSAVHRGWVAMELSRVDASIATFVGVTNGLAMGSIAVTGSPAQRERWLPAMARGEVVGAFGLTEPGSGSDAARGLTTTARREGGTWVLDGAKRWIGNATFADVVVVWARDVADDQVKGFLVPGDTPGFTATKIEDKIALRTVQNADVVLDGVRVPEEQRLQSAHSFKDTATVLRLTRAEVAWQAVGVAMGAYEAALDYAQRREQFGRPIAARQLVQDLLVRSLGDITASLALCVQVSRLLDAGRQHDAHSALAKAYTTTRMRETVARCREVLGGNGIVPEHGVARYFADAEAIYSYEGTREMNTLIVGRAITGHAAFA
ncbi:acyl-CoA dehydrogenase family protein [Kineococcus sp. SYSU DK018]|uniref:acyl-CoA dehydrogenase family protein n=1 Tax=Kineococcus sp. SYSU DK018 TaxID=3383139 RepID=UPI003D7D2841